LGDKLLDHRLVAVDQKMHEGVGAQHVVEVDDEALAAFTHRHQARQAEGGPPVLHRPEQGGVAGVAHIAEALEVVAADAPAGGGQHQAPGGDPGKEWLRAEAPPVPPSHEGGVGLQRAQEAVERQARSREAVGVGDPGDDAPTKAPGVQNDLVADHGDRQVVHRDLVIGGKAGAAEVWDLIAAQSRAKHDVAQAAGGKVNHVGKDGIGVEGLLGAHQTPNMVVQQRVAMAEAGQQTRPRWAREGPYEHQEPAPVEVVVGLRRHGGHHGQAVTTGAGRGLFHFVQVGVGEIDLAGTGGCGSHQPGNESLLPPGPQGRFSGRR